MSVTLSNNTSDTSRMRVTENRCTLKRYTATVLLIKKQISPFVCRHWNIEAFGIEDKDGYKP